MSDGEFLNQQELEEYRKELLTKHLNVGTHKAVSYLPIKAIEGMLGLSVTDYRVLIEKAGHRSAVFTGNESCIESGAVFAYSVPALDLVLRRHTALLEASAWSVASDEFIKRIAAEWFEMDDPIKLVIDEAFGKKRK